VGHRLILWDNYPVNDEHPTLNLGPVTGRDPDLCEVVDGYMSNSQCPQNEINRLPMLTCADFAYNSWGYDPSRSIEQAIEHLGENDEQREALAALAQEYPGNLLFNIWYDYNPVRARFSRLEEFADGGARAAAHVRRVERLLDQFRLAFPGAYLDARKTLEADVEWMNARRGQPLR
jgi:hypothetical protein